MQQASKKARPELKTFTPLHNHYLKFSGVRDTCVDACIKNFLKKRNKKILLRRLIP